MSGRVFNDLDTEESMRVVVINKAMTKHWDGTDPVGSHVRPVAVRRMRRRRA